jgi:hypothetical protein
MSALPARLGQPRTPVPSSTFEVVARRINQPTSLVQHALFDSTLFGATTLHLGTVGVLRIDEPFSAIQSGRAPTWQATGRLYGHGPRVVRFNRVELEVAVWSDDASELRLRPVARGVTRWGARRQRRYFALAHESADFILHLVTAAARTSDERDTSDSPKRSRSAAA